MRSLLCCFGVLLSLASALTAQSPVFDATFAPNPNIDVRAVFVQPDGKTLVGGGFTQIAGVNRSYFVRLNVDGTLDAAFNPIVGGGAVYAIEQQADGKILIGGSFSSVTGQSRLRVARLNLDGTLDSSFNANLFGNIVRDILLVPGGKIFIAGDFNSIGGVPRTGLARLNPDGSLDASYVGDAADRNAPASSPGVFTIAQQTDGRLLIGGQFGVVNGVPRRGLARLSTNGVIDIDFDPLNGVSAASIQKVIVQRDGRFIVAGSFSAIAGQARAHLVRFSAEGTLESSFNPRPSSAVFSVAELTDGALLVGGLFSQVGTISRSYLARLLPDGQVDPVFPIEATGPTVPTSPGVQEIAISGRWIVIGGSFTSVAGVARAQLARLTTPDPHSTVPVLNHFAVAGDNLRLSPAVLGAAGTYQWRKDGVPISSATNVSLTLTNVNATHVGIYELTATNAFGSISSGFMSVNLGVRPQIVVAPGSVTVTTGQPATLSAVATGTPSPTYQWLRNGVAIAGASAPTFTITVNASSGDSYAVRVTNAVGSITSGGVSITELPPPRLANVSVRTRLANAQSLIVGFSVSGGPASVLMRAAGPALAGFGINDAMSDPRIELYRDSTKLLENDNWPGILSPTFTNLAAFPFGAGSRDAALMELLNGSHSVVTNGTAAGVVLVEAYDVLKAQGRLVNVSARNLVGTGEDILIAGFICSGQGSMRVLVRAVGPTLGGAPFGVAGVLDDPILELYDAAGVKIAENDNYEAVTAATFPTVGAFALAPGARDAALVVSVSGGRSYTAQVKGQNSATGVALLEIYELR